MRISNFNKFLLASTGLFCLLLAARIYKTESIYFIFLGWNLFLAWLPWLLSVELKLTNKTWFNCMIFCAWLLFFPNSLYIITDLIHLKGESKMPIWYDAILVFIAASTGMFMGFASLLKVEKFYASFIPKKYLFSVGTIILFLAAFGVYLGRFGRYNSWDIVQKPMTLAMDIFDRIINPLQHSGTWAMTIVLSALYILIFYGIKLMQEKRTWNS